MENKEKRSKWVNPREFPKEEGYYLIHIENQNYYAFAYFDGLSWSIASNGFVDGILLFTIEPIPKGMNILRWKFLF